MPHKIIIGFNLILILLLLVLSQSSELYAEIVDRVIAKVNDEIITLSDMKTLDIPALESLGLKINGEADREKELLNIIINKKLQLQYAKSEGIIANHEDINSAIESLKEMNSLTDEMLNSYIQRENLTMNEYEDKLKEQIVINKLTAMEVRSRILIEDSEVNDYYERHKVDFLLPNEVHVRNIMLLCCEGLSADDKKRIEKKLKDILTMALSGKDFADLAKTYSEGPNAANGGDMGFFKEGLLLPEIDKAVFNMKKGEISQVLRSGIGLHIVKVEEIKKNLYKPLKEVRNIIEQQVFLAKFKKKYESWINELRMNSFVEVTL